MAKIGNESRLILKLAREQMSRREEAYRKRFTSSKPERVPGYIDCLEEYASILDLIALELEGKI